MDDRSTIARVPHYHLHYQMTERQHRSVILFLHGFMGDCHEFDAAIAQLAPQFCCLSVDLPGHGNTTVLKEDGYGMAETAQALIELLESLSIQQCVLVGYSMGGRLALYLTLQFPQYFNCLILISASPGLLTPAERQQRQQHDRQLATELETGEFAAFLDRWYDQPLFAGIKHHPNFAELRQRRLQNQPRELAKSLHALGTGRQPSLWEQLPHNQVPLLLLVGAEDEKFVQINRAIAQTCPMAQLQVVPDCSHALHLTAVDTFVTRLIEFVQMNGCNNSLEAEMFH